MKNGFMWMYVAPGSGVSVNIGRTRAFDSASAAEEFIRTILDISVPIVPGCRAAALKTAAAGLDSIQILVRIYMAW